MIFNNNRLRELEQENQQWQQWYQAQQLPPQYPQYPQPYQPAPPKAKKKAKKGRNKVNPNPLSNEARMWIFIGIMSFFAIIIVKNWLTDATTTPTPERVEKRKK